MPHNMLQTKFDIHDLTRAAGQIARLVPAEELFTLLARSITIPAGWVALASRVERDPLLIAGGQRCEANNLLDVLFVRAIRFECSAEHDTVRSIDGFACHGSLRLPVRVLTEPAELAAFRRTVLGSSTSMTESMMSRFLQPHLQTVLCELAEKHTAEELVAGLDAERVRPVAERRIGPACLAAGLALDGSPSVTFESPAWREHLRQQTQLEHRRRQTQARAQIQEAIAAAQREQLDHLLTLVKGLTEVAEGQKIGLPQLLAGFSDTERGQLYAALWHVPAAAASRHVAGVSGDEVLLFDPECFQKPSRRVKVPEGVGPLRSIALSDTPALRGRLLLGAAWGVHLVSFEGPRVHTQTLHAPANPREPQGGFNAVTATETQVFATHSELGLIVWKLPDQMTGMPIEGAALARDITRGATAVRCARVSDGHLWFTADACLWALPLDDRDAALPMLYRCGGATLTAICFAEGTVYSADASGAIRACDVGDPESMRVVRQPTGRPIESLQILETCGVLRLLIADRSSGLTAMVLGDQYARRYEYSSAIIRRAAAAPDLFVAMNDARDRLIAWDPRRPDAPIAAVVIPHLTGSTLQDIAIIPA